MIGETIGNFRIVARIGRGGMGDVWLAEQQSVGTKVAIKMLRTEISEDQGQIDRFFNEARAVSTIRHAGIVKIFDVGVHAGRAYLVMEYLDGESLGTRLRRLGRLGASAVTEIARQTASVLDATHSAAIIHRDLKPDNLFLTVDHELASRERVKVLDFGIAKLIGTTSPGTHGTMGTPAYMAPEQWGDAATVDWRADAYSLGCLAFEMACGRPPFVATTFAEACAKHLGEQPPSARSIVPELPVALDELFARLLAKRPGDRATSMAEIQRELSAIAATLPPAVAAAPTLPPEAVAPTISSQRPVLAPPVARDAPTVGTTLGAAATAISAPAPGRSRRGWVAAAVAVAAVAGVAAFVVRARGGSTVAADARARDAAQLDATPASEVPPGDAIALDATPPPPIDAAVRPDAVPHHARDVPQHTIPRDDVVDPEDFPDEVDIHVVDKINDELAAYVVAHCGPWPKGVAVNAVFRIDFGVASEFQVVAPDSHSQRCITKVFANGKYPRAKTGVSASVGLNQ